MDKQFEQHVLNNKIDIYTKEKSNLINQYIYKQERMDRLATTSLFSYFTMIVISSFFLFIVGKLIYINEFNYSAVSIVFICLFLLLLFAPTKMMLSNIQEMNTSRKILKVELHNDVESINNLDAYKLEDGLVYMYQQAIEKSANNTLNKSIHRQLKHDLEKFIFHSNKSDIFKFIEVWYIYDTKFFQSIRQIYN